MGDNTNFAVRDESNLLDIEIKRGKDFIKSISVSSYR